MSDMLTHIEQTVSALGAKVAAARAERGWSLPQLAPRAGLSTASVHKIEKSGMTPTIASLMKIATRARHERRASSSTRPTRCGR